MHTMNRKLEGQLNNKFELYWHGGNLSDTKIETA